MKMSTSCSKSACKAVLGAVLALSQIDPPVCLIAFGSFVSLDLARFGFCSSWQSCRTRLVLQLRQLHHLLIRHGLGVIHSRNGSISRASLCLNGRRARRRGRPASAQQWHLAPVHRLWPRSSAPDARMTSTATPPCEWTRPFPLSRLSRQKLCRSGVAVASSLRRARAHSSLHHHPPKLAQCSAVTCSPTSTLKLAVKPSDEPTFPTFPKSGRRDRFLRRAQC